MSALLPTYARSDLSFARGEGAFLYTASGDRYLDFSSGIAVTALGHAHPRLVAALTDQAEKLWHVSNLHRIPEQERLAENSAPPLSPTGCSSPTRAPRRLNVRSRRRAGIISRLARPSATGLSPSRAPFTAGFCHHCRRRSGKTPRRLRSAVDGFDQVEALDIGAVEGAIGEETAGILIEPIMGEGGMREVSWRFLQDLRALADEKGILLLLDEVQTGMGRSGRLFAHEWAGITPDILAAAKGLGGGFPVGACLTTEAVGAAMTAGSHGSTFGGNPLAVAVGNAVLDVMLADGFLDNVAQMGLRLKQRLAALKDEHPDIIEEVRGQGLMLGLKCKVPNQKLVEALRAEQMLTVQAGDNVVRLLPPLIIGGAEIELAAVKLEAACAALATASVTA